MFDDRLLCDQRVTAQVAAAVLRDPYRRPVLRPHAVRFIQPGCNPIDSIPGTLLFPFPAQDVRAATSSVDLVSVCGAISCLPLCRCLGHAPYCGRPQPSWHRKLGRAELREQAREIVVRPLNSAANQCLQCHSEFTRQQGIRRVRAVRGRELPGQPAHLPQVIGREILALRRYNGPAQRRAPPAQRMIAGGVSTLAARPQSVRIGHDHHPATITGGHLITGSHRPDLSQTVTIPGPVT